MLLENRKMSWSKKVFSSQSSEETKVVYKTSKNKSEKGKKDNDPQISKMKIEERIKKAVREAIIAGLVRGVA